MAIRARGETEITVSGIGRITLCLTLAGMAELEDAFAVDNLQKAIAKVSENPSSTAMATVIHALMIGVDGNPVATVEDIRRWKITPAEIREAMAAMNAGDDEGNAPANRHARRAASKA